MLVDLACESGRTVTDATKEYSSGYLCKKCFNSTAKYFALKEEVNNLKEELLLKLSAISDGENSAISNGIKKIIFAEMKGLLKESTVTVSGA